MSPPLFVDTSAFFALFNPRDARHEEAGRLHDALQGFQRPLFTSTDVFDEVVTLLRSRTGIEHAVRIGEGLRNGEAVRLIPVDDEIRDSAWEIFKSHALPGLSFTDCTSSAVMRSRGIREVFTFDADFRRLGHQTLPPPRPLLKPAIRRRG